MKITKKDIAIKLDAANPLFNFNVEKGKTSYHNYNKSELLTILKTHTK